MLKTILVITPDPPYPPNQGCRRDIWSHVIFFHNAGWRVVLVECRLGSGSNPEIYSAELPIDIDFHFVLRNSRWSGTENNETVSMVQKLIDSYKPEVVWFEYAHFASLASVLNLNGAKLWFRPHNFELAHAIDKMLASRPWLNWRGYKAPKQALAWTKNFCCNLRNIYIKERLMHRIAEQLFFISYGDLRFMSQLYGGTAKKYWVPTFLESESIPVKDDKTPLDVIYLGTYVCQDNPNMAGARKLLHEVIPAVEKTMPGAFRFHLVGQGGYEQFSKYASETVMIHDYIHDLSGFMQNMDIACFPIKLGWGCKIKMLEALASGLPLVGADQTFRGVPTTPEAYYPCYKTQDYVDSLRLLQDSNQRKRTAMLGKAAYTAWLTEGQSILYTALADMENSIPESSSRSKQYVEAKILG